MAFLHGVETNEVKQKTFTVTDVPSAIICLTGAAPKGPLNTLTVVRGTTDAAQFGLEVPGFSIPQALANIFAQGSATVVVVNTYDPSTMVTAVTAEAQTVTGRKIQSAYVPIFANSAVVVKDVTNATTYVLGTDYTVDEFGNFTILATAIADGAILHLTYKKLDASALTSSVIVGTITSGVKTGMKLFADVQNLYGFTPKILIAPGYSTLSGVATQMTTDAPTYRATALIDAPAGTLIADAIAGRGPSGSIGFYTSNKRIMLMFPYLKGFSPYTNAAENRPFSQFFAGVISNTDKTSGYHVSPSNKQIVGVTGAERVIVGSLTDSNADNQQLNAVGITTIFNGFGTGILTWGNRNASYPVNTTIDSFMCVRRTADIIEESVEVASIQGVDITLDQAGIDTIRESVNQYLRTLKGRKVIVDGVCTFDPAKNPPSQLASGQAIFDYEFVSGPPMERITYNSYININLLSNIK